MNRALRTGARPASAGALLLLLLGPLPAASQLLQADLTLAIPARGHRRVQEKAPIESGPATLAVTARDLRGDAVVVDLLFDYRLPPDQIGLDELVDRIEIQTESAGGDPFFATTLDTNEIPLNPDRVALRYRVTLYRPPGEAYVVRVRVFGNYE